MKYISTRGHGPVSFEDVLLGGLAPDGGLYVPQLWPTFSPEEWKALRGKPYEEVAFHILKPFVGGAIDDRDLKAILQKTYGRDRFDHEAVAPLVQIGPDEWIMELWRGPTLAFKDYALQLLGELFDHVLSKRDENITIVGATSGDTGSAAIEGCRHSKHCRIYILHPKGRTSDVQRRQMTTVNAPNVHNIAIEGNFDDCQALVKALFADNDFSGKVNLTAINSINWARISAQVVYYVTAALALGAPDRPVRFAVPTGNFGNVFAAHCARKMGLPMELVIGTNRNDIITRFFESGEMSLGTVAPSLSPSMDIQISSNFERYLFELMDHESSALEKGMRAFRDTGKLKVGGNLLEKARQDFFAARCGEEDTLKTMKDVYSATGGYVIDPHTAVGIHAARSAPQVNIPTVSLACAHPSKFPDAVERAIGHPPPVPERLKEALAGEEHYDVLANDLELLKGFITQQ